MVLAFLCDAFDESPGELQLSLTSLGLYLGTVQAAALSQGKRPALIDLQLATVPSFTSILTETSL